MAVTWLHSTDPAVVARVVLIDNITGDKVDATLSVNDDPNTRYVLSRFAWLRRDARNLVIESSLAHAHARVIDPRVAALVATLTAPTSLDDAADRSGLSRDETRIVVAALMTIGAIRVQGDSTHTSPENQVPITWEFHDLLFHTRARAGRSPLRLSKSPLARGLSREEDAHPGDLALPEIDVLQEAAQDPPFGHVVERRRSVRDFGAGPIAARALAELLARVMGTRADGDANRRRFPSGGAVFEVDAVILAFNVSDLDKGAYLYRPVHHSLRPLHGDAQARDFLGRMAARAAGQPPENIPPAVVVFAARFNSLGSHYQGITYSLMLKHVGVLMAMMNLTAPLVGLGSVPLGLGDSDQFSDATGLEYYRHGSIGELALSHLV